MQEPLEREKDEEYALRGSTGDNRHYVLITYFVPHQPRDDIM